MKAWTPLMIAIMATTTIPRPVEGKRTTSVKQERRGETYPAMTLEWKGGILKFKPFYDSGQARTRAFLKVWQAGILSHPRLLFAMYGIWYRYGLPSRIRIVAATRDELTIEAPGLPVGRAGIYAKRFGVKSEVKGSRLSLRLR